MSDNRKFGYTLGTTFRRANVLGTRYGADVFCVVRRRGPRPRTDIYRNTGINWARNMDLNTLEQRSMNDATFRLSRPSNYITASTLNLSDPETSEDNTAGATIAAPLTLEDWANMMQESHVDHGPAGENAEVSVTPANHPTLDDWAHMMQDGQFDQRVTSDNAAASIDAMLGTSWVDLSPLAALTTAMPAAENEAQANDSSGFPGLTINTGIDPAMLQRHGARNEQMWPTSEGTEVISAGLAGLNMTLPDVDYETLDMDQLSPAAEGIFDFEKFDDDQVPDGTGTAE